MIYWISNFKDYFFNYYLRARHNDLHNLMISVRIYSFEQVMELQEVMEENGYNFSIQIND